MEEVATKILSDRHCHLGEGCTYDPATDTAWWFDIVERTLLQAELASGAVSTHALPMMASVVAFIDDRRQLLGTENGLYLRDIRDGRLSLHVPLEADNAATRSNDGRVHPCGALWIGTMGRKRRKRRGRDLSLWRRRTAPALRGHLHPECDLFFARWFHRLFHRYPQGRSLSRYHRPDERAADR